MGGRREWFKHDAWFLADDKIRDLGHEFGPAGPLVIEALLELAKRQRDGGNVRVKWSYLAEHSFANRRGLVQKIVGASASLGLLEIVENDSREVAVFLPKWAAIQGQGLSGAERTAAWRDRNQSHGDADVTSQNGHSNGDVTSPHAGGRAVAKEGERERANALSSSEPAGTDPKATEDDIRLCRLLAELAKAANPKFKVRSRDRWLTDMRLCRERDENTPEEIERLLRWVFTDKSGSARFWQPVIRSPASLREHFAQMWAQMTADATPSKAGAAVEGSAAYLARKGLG